MYDCKIDVWSAGCILAELIFGDEPFFSGKSDAEELSTVAAVVGSSDLLTWSAGRIRLTPILRRSIGRRIRTPFTEYRRNEYSSYVSNHSLDLLMKMLTVDPSKRFSAKECVDHPFFDDCRDALIPNVISP